MRSARARVRALRRRHLFSDRLQHVPNHHAYDRGHVQRCRHHMHLRLRLQLVFLLMYAGRERNRRVELRGNGMLIRRPFCEHDRQPPSY